MNPHGDEIQPQTRTSAMCADVVQQVTAKLGCRRCRLLLGKPHPHERVSQSLRSWASKATAFSLGPHLHSLLNGTRVQEGDRRVAESAFARVFQINRRSALRAGYLADLRSDPLQFRRSQAANKLLFPQKLKERCESPIPIRAPEIRKSAGLRQVVAEYQGAGTARAVQLVCDRLTGVIPM